MTFIFISLRIKKNNMNAVAYFDPLSNQGVSGSVRFSQPSPKDPVTVTLSLQGFRPCQTHAIHIHEYGDLTKGCMSTGKHLNPGGDPHGSVYFTEKRHAGDLINNLFTDDKGSVQLSFSDKRLSLILGKPECVVGRSVVIHHYPDDYGLGGLLEDGMLIPYEKMSLGTLRTLTKQRGYPVLTTKQALVKKLVDESSGTGNAGGRMACAVIGLASS